MESKKIDLRAILSSTNPGQKIKDTQLLAIGQFLLKLYAEQ